MSELPIQVSAGSVPAGHGAVQGPFREAPPTATAAGEAHAAAPHDSCAFRRLLESIERMGQRSQAAPESIDAATLPAALQKAEDDFGLAMDLRRRLEGAFRARNR